MQNTTGETARPPGKKRKERKLFPLLLLCIGVSVAAVSTYYFLRHTPIGEELITRKNGPPADLTLPGVPTKDGSQQQYSLSANSSDSQDDSSVIGREEEAVREDNADTAGQTGMPAEQVADQAHATAVGSTNQPIPPEPGFKEPAEARTAIESFYSHLDQQPYVSNFHLDTTSKVYFSQLVQKMLDTPPVVSGETNDLFTVLQNTAHFFRVVGRQNMLVLKAIISNEQTSHEDILANFYTISQQPDYLRESFSINLKEDALYDYAGFFLTTMGGRLYLFRRDSSLRMIVSYYSILVVDEAIQSGRNRHGIDIRPAIDNLIGEIENSGNQLQLKEHYLDKLYDLKEKYL